jgi:hypothetical protein
MLRKEVAYIQTRKTYRGFVSDTLWSLISPASASRMSHSLVIEWYLDMIEDDGYVVSHYVIDRQVVMCGSEAPHELSGHTLNEAINAVQDMLKELTSDQFQIVESGPYWYNFKLVRDWGSGDENPFENIPIRYWGDVDKEQQRQGETRYQAEEERQGENRRAAHARQRETAQTERSRRSASVWDTFADLVFLK